MKMAKGKFSGSDWARPVNVESRKRGHQRSRILDLSLPADVRAMMEVEGRTSHLPILDAAEIASGDNLAKLFEKQWEKLP